MFQHYFQSAVRNLLKRKFFSLINVAGLAIGMSCCMLIALYVQNELSYDRYNSRHNKIYRVIQTFQSLEKGQKMTSPLPEDYQVWGCAPVGPALAADFPKVQAFTRFMSPVSLLLEYQGKRMQQDNLICIDSTAFDVFSWKLMQGNAKTALIAPYSIVLTEKVAEKLFGHTRALGKTVRVDNNDLYTVTGVVESPPANSQISFNGLISMSTARKWREDIFYSWDYVDFYTYFLLKDQADIEPLRRAVPAFLKRHISQELGYTIAFESIDDAYLSSKAARQPGPVGSMANIYLFCCIGLIILVIACVNFINLSTARSLERAKEVGVRKVLGGYSSTIRIQFLLESILISMAAALLSVVFSKLSLPFVGRLSGKDFSANALFTWQFALCTAFLALLVGLLAGIYPSVFLSSFRPIAVLKGTIRSSGRDLSLRKALVIFQFTLSIALISGTAIVYNQLKFINQHDLGFTKDQMLVINFNGDGQVQKTIKTVKRALAQQSGVISVAASRAVPGEFLPNAGTVIQGPDGKLRQKTPLIYEIDDDFIPCLQIPLLAGRNYSPAFPNDSSQGMIINEAALKLYGYQHPVDAVGKKFAQWGRQGTIVGVVKDFNFRSLHSKVEPLTLRYGKPDVLGRILVSIKGDHISSTVEALERTWKTVAPQRPFLYSFLDQSFSKQYDSDMHFAYLVSLFSGLAIFIACLGLFALATFTAQQRTKEIGVRKVLGASIFNIWLLICKDFMLLVLIATGIAIPLCLWMTSHWLNDFAYRIRVSPLIFLATAVGAIIIALATISWQSIKVALINPVQSIRNE